LREIGTDMDILLSLAAKDTDGKEEIIEKHRKIRT
jgi:hypothetical protein